MPIYKLPISALTSYEGFKKEFSRNSCGVEVLWNRTLNMDSWQENAGTEFDIITDLTEIQVGDIFVLESNCIGLVDSIEDGIVAQLGSDELIELSSIIGAYRYKAWQLPSDVVEEEEPIKSGRGALESNSYTWVKVKAIVKDKEYEGWIVSHYLNNLAKTTAAVNLRENPSITDKILICVPKNTTIEYSVVEDVVVPEETIPEVETVVPEAGEIVSKDIIIPEATIPKKVRVKRGAKTYTGGNLANFVYQTIYDVIEVDGDLAVIGIGKAAIATMCIDDLTEIIPLPELGNCPYTINLDKSVKVYTGPTIHSTIKRTIDVTGIYTVIEESHGTGAQVWGRLNIGWIIIK